MDASDRELVVMMRRYFAAKAELADLKAQLEGARQAAGEPIDVFYDPRRNVSHVGDLQRLHRLRGEMVLLMHRAEAWGRADLAANRHERSETRAAIAEPLDIDATALPWRWPA